MTHKFQINIDNNTLIEEFIGDIDLDALNQSGINILDDEKFKQGLNFITDLRQANLKLGHADLLQTIYQMPDLGINKHALITESELQYGLSREFIALSDILAEHAEVCIFSDFNTGLKWLSS